MWPAERSLLTIEPDDVQVTAFRVDEEGVEVVLNDLSGTRRTIVYQGESVDLKPFGIVSAAIDKPSNTD
jgi:hypothetical protein